MQKGKDFTYMRRLFMLLRNVMNYHNLRECRLQVGHVMSCHVSIIYCHGTHSCIMHVFTQKQYILCSALQYESYLTLPYVTSLRDSFCLGTFAQLYYAATLQPRLQEAACWQLDGPNVYLPFFFFFLRGCGR